MPALKTQRRRQLFGNTNKGKKFRRAAEGNYERRIVNLFMPLTNTMFTTKIQYNTFEPGEFIEIKKRNYSAVIELIENFPWEEQRHNIAIDLTCPSVTIEDDNSNYLKLALYYNRKFVLYFFDGKNLFSKSLFKYVDAYDYIKECFETLSIDYTQYKKENVLFKSLNTHFQTSNFIYTVYNDKPFKYIGSTTKLFLLGSLGLLIYSLTGVNNSIYNFLGMLFIFLIYFPIMGGINLILSISYFRHSKGKMLQLSKGSQTFQYGDIDNPKTFNKSDVSEIIIKQNTASRCPWNDFTLTFLCMKDGTKIKICNILLSGTNIQIKMPTITTTTQFTYVPYLKSK